MHKIRIPIALTKLVNFQSFVLQFTLKQLHLAKKCHFLSHVSCFWPIFAKEQSIDPLEIYYDHVKSSIRPSADPYKRYRLAGELSKKLSNGPEEPDASWSKMNTLLFTQRQ